MAHVIQSSIFSLDSHLDSISSRIEHIAMTFFCTSVSRSWAFFSVRGISEYRASNLPKSVTISGISSQLGTLRMVDFILATAVFLSWPSTLCALGSKFGKEIELQTQCIVVMIDRHVLNGDGYLEYPRITR